MIHRKDDDLMSELLETVSYAGDETEIRPWQEIEELATSEDEPDDPDPVPSKRTGKRTRVELSEMNLYGTSEGQIKGWETRHGRGEGGQGTPEHRERIAAVAKGVVADMGGDPSIVTVVSGEPHTVDADGKQHTQYAIFRHGDDAVSDEIEVNAGAIGPEGSMADEAWVKGVVAHETMHKLQSDLGHEIAGEQAGLKRLKGTEWHRERFNEDGTVKPERADDVAKAFPASQALASLTGGKAVSRIEDVTDEAIAAAMNDPGMSAYAKQFLQAAQRDPKFRQAAVTETLAEAARSIAQPESWRGEKKPDPNGPWVTAAKAVIAGAKQPTKASGRDIMKTPGMSTTERDRIKADRERMRDEARAKLPPVEQEYWRQRDSGKDHAGARAAADAWAQR